MNIGHALDNTHPRNWCTNAPAFMYLTSVFLPFFSQRVKVC